MPSPSLSCVDALTLTTSIKYPRSLFPREMDWSKMQETETLVKTAISKQYALLPLNQSPSKSRSNQINNSNNKSKPRQEQAKEPRRLKVPPNHLFTDYPIGGRVKANKNWLVGQSWYRPGKGDLESNSSYSGIVKGYLWEYHRWNLLVLWDLQKYDLCWICELGKCEKESDINTNNNDKNKVKVINKNLKPVLQQQKNLKNYKTCLSENDIKIIADAIKYRHYRKIWDGDSRRAMDLLWHEEKQEKLEKRKTQNTITSPKDKNNNNNNNNDEDNHDSDEEDANTSTEMKYIKINYNDFEQIQTILNDDEINFNIKFSMQGMYIYDHPSLLKPKNTPTWQPELNLQNEISDNIKENIFVESETLQFELQRKCQSSEEREEKREPEYNFSFVYRSPFTLKLEDDNDDNDDNDNNNKLFDRSNQTSKSQINLIDQKTP